MLADTTKDAIRAAYARLKEGLPGFRARASQGRMIAVFSFDVPEDVIVQTIQSLMPDVQAVKSR